MRAHIKIKLIAIIMLMASYQTVFGGAFLLYGEANGVNAGDYAAGAAVEAGDASTLFYNPAGLSWLDGRQWVAGANLIDTHARFSSGSSTWDSLLFPLPSFERPIGGIRTRSLSAVPAFYFSNPLTSAWTVGVGVFVPYGLQTDWGEQAETRYAATLSKLNVINLSPALAYRWNQRLSVGVGLDVQFADVDFNAVSGLPTEADPTFFDSSIENHAHSTGWGGHVGALLQVNERWRVGVNYQTMVRHRFHGQSTLTGPLGDPFNNNVSIDDDLRSDPIHLPAQFTFSLLRRQTSHLDLMATVAYAKWSKLNQIALHNVASPGGFPPMEIVVPENFRDTWRVAGGLRYRLTDNVALRAGVGYDQTPTNQQDRNIRLPDSDRFATAIGVRYQFSPAVSGDLGWTHFFTRQVSIDNTTNAGGTATILIDGKAHSHINVIGAQLSWHCN